MVRLGEPHAAPVARMAPQPRPVQAHPQQVLRIGRFGDERAFHLHREIKARRGDAVRGIQIIVIVDDVDAADERNASIHNGDLAMQPSQPAARRNKASEPARFRPEDAALGACVQQHRAHVLDAHGAAEAIQHHPHFDAAPRRRRQALQHLRAGAIHHENIGFQMHADLRGVDSRTQRGEEVGAVLQQADVVAVRPFQLDLLGLHGSSSSASKGE
ncbi:hypothetical protein D3C87_1387130 [compost metagenome]